MNVSLRSIKLWQWFLGGLILLFVPFPSEMVPEWRMQFSDEAGLPSQYRVVEQSWKSYTYFAAEGYDRRCTDESGSVVFPKRYLWSGILARIASPLLARMMTLVHGSEGTTASVRLFDRYYVSGDYYWSDKMSAYSHFPDPSVPSIGIARQRDPYTDLPICERIL